MGKRKRNKRIKKKEKKDNIKAKRMKKKPSERK